MMNSKLLVLASLILASILVSGCTSQSQTDGANASAEKVKISFEITANGSTESKIVEAGKGSNAFEVMKANFQLEYNETAYGAFIQSINGINAGNDEYWALYVNGAYADKGINQYTLEKDTKIEWKIEKVDLSGFS